MAEMNPAEMIYEQTMTFAALVTALSNALHDAKVLPREAFVDAINERALRMQYDQGIDPEKLVVLKNIAILIAKGPGQ